MNIVTQTAPKVARVRRNKVTGQLDLFAPVAEPVIPVPDSPTRKRKYPTNARYVFLTDGTLSLARCSVCEKFKEIAEFRKAPGHKHGISSFCVTCSCQYQRDRYHREGGKTARNQHLRETYGITLEQYESILSSQGGVCAICGGKETGRYRTNTVKSFAVDHCHATGKVRGLLCTACNTGLGSLRDSLAILESAQAYLQKHI